MLSRSLIRSSGCPSVIVGRSHSLRSGAIQLACVFGFACVLAGSTAAHAHTPKAAAATSTAPAIAQPGAPAQPGKILPGTTHAWLPPLAHVDIEFMQGMSMHHSQAVEMTALVASHAASPDVRRSGTRCRPNDPNKWGADANRIMLSPPSSTTRSHNKLSQTKSKAPLRAGLLSFHPNSSQL